MRSWMVLAKLKTWRKPSAQAGRAAERPVQVGAAVAPGRGCEQHVVGGDAVQHDAAGAAAEGQRDPDHQFEDGEIAFFLLAQPVGARRFFPAHGAGGVRLPAAT